MVLLSDVGAAPSLNPSPQTAVLTRPATGQQYSFTPSPNTLPACPVPDAPSVAVLRRDNARVSIINSSLGGTYRVHYGVRGFVLGSPDDLMKSYMTLFGAVGQQAVFRQVLDKFYRGTKDEATLRLIGRL